MSYANETWATKVEDEEKLERAEMRMIRWMSGISLIDRQSSDELRQRMGLDNRDIIQRERLRWYGHIQCLDETNVKKVLTLEVEGK